MSAMSILLDMDGVLVDFIGGLVRHLKLGRGVRSYIKKRFGTKQQCPYDLTELFDCSDDDLSEALTVDFWANLKPTPWCKKLIEEICPSGSTFLCTSAGCLGDEHEPYFRNAILGKERWIVKHLPVAFREQVIFAQWKTLLASGNILIDDTESWRLFFPDMVLVPAPWNANYNIYWEGDQAVIDYIASELKHLSTSCIGRLRQPALAAAS